MNDTKKADFGELHELQARNPDAESVLLTRQHRPEVRGFSRFVCQIMIPTADSVKANGTGFLIGRNLVLTNYHVVKGWKPTQIKVRFDVKETGNPDFEFGDLYGVVEIVSFSPYSALEKSGQYSSNSKTHPSLEELDYACLRLKKNVGSLKVKPSEGLPPMKRGWLELATSKPKVNAESDVYILQHPFGGMLKDANGPLAPAQPTESRIRYLTETLPGSSGSPCFQWSTGRDTQPSALTLVAMHNYGDPSWCGDKSGFNHGPPIHLIAKQIKADQSRIAARTISKVVLLTIVTIAITIVLLFNKESVYLLISKLPFGWAECFQPDGWVKPDTCNW